MMVMMVVMMMSLKIMLNHPPPVSTLSPLWPTYPEITRRRLIYGSPSHFLKSFVFLEKRFDLLWSMIYDWNIICSSQILVMCVAPFFIGSCCSGSSLGRGKERSSRMSGIGRGRGSPNCSSHPLSFLGSICFFFCFSFLVIVWRDFIRDIEGVIICATPPFYVAAY